MDLRGLLSCLHEGVSEFVFGAAISWVSVPYILKRRAEGERILALVTFGYLVGMPISPPSFTVRFLPYVVPQILYWRRRMALWDDELEHADLKHLGH